MAWGGILSKVLRCLLGVALHRSRSRLARLARSLIAPSMPFRSAGGLVLGSLLLLATGCGKGGQEREVRRGGMYAVLPSVAQVGEPVTLHVAPLDSLGLPVGAWTGRPEIASSDPAMTTLGAFVPGEGHVTRAIMFRTPGLHRVTVTADGDTAIAGPVRVVTSEEELRVRAGEPARRLLWGDAHGHTDVGDGSHPPEHFLFYGRNIARLDYLCVSEHDFQQFLDVGFDMEEGSWETVADLARKWRRPDFAVLLGWEWSSREHGHRVILFPGDSTRYVSYRVAPTPADLAESMRGSGAISVLAHPTGSELTPFVNWDSVVPGFDVAVEIYSGHGAMDESGYRPTSDPRPGYSAVDALRRGFDLAFVAFSDTHLSTPGNPWPPPIRDAPYPGGMTAVWAEGTGEAAVVEALRAGRAYASSGERFYLEFRAGDRTFGETLVAAPNEPVRVQALAAAMRAVAWVEILADERVLARREPGQPTWALDETLGPFEGDVALWMRGASADGDRFWTTPVRVASS